MRHYTSPHNFLKSPEDFDAFLARKQLSESDYFERVAAAQTQQGTGSWPKETLRQIARGYYAKRDEIVDRAFDSWLHYEQHGDHLFDRLYLLGLANPTDYQRQQHKGEQIAWANGGRNQRSPLHVVELAAARAAGHFFTTAESSQRVFLLGTRPGATEHGDALGWDDLGSHRDNDFGRSMAAALVGYNWARYTWVDQLDSFEELAKATQLSALRREIGADAYAGFHGALVAAEQAVRAALDDVSGALAWETESARIMHRWCRDAETFGETGVLVKQANTFDLSGGRSLTVGLKHLGATVTGSRDVASDNVSQQAVQCLRAVWADLAMRIHDPARPPLPDPAEQRIGARS